MRDARVSVLGEALKNGPVSAEGILDVLEKAGFEVLPTALLDPVLNNSLPFGPAGLGPSLDLFEYQRRGVVSRKAEIDPDEGFWYVDTYTSNSVYKRHRGRWWDPSAGRYLADDEFRPAGDLLKLLPGPRLVQQ